MTSRTKKIVLSVMSLAILCGVAAGVVSFGFLYYYEQIVGERIRSQYGFAHGTPYSTETGEVFVIERIERGGVFDQAGFREGDIIADNGTIGFYQTLNRAESGDKVSFIAIPFEDQRPLSERPSRTVKLTVP